jgi:hypothetical protein
VCATTPDSDIPFSFFFYLKIPLPSLFPLILVEETRHFFFHRLLPIFNFLTACLQVSPPLGFLDWILEAVPYAGFLFYLFIIYLFILVPHMM